MILFSPTCIVAPNCLSRNVSFQSILVCYHQALQYLDFPFLALQFLVNHGSSFLCSIFLLYVLYSIALCFCLFEITSDESKRRKNQSRAVFKHQEDKNHDHGGNTQLLHNEGNKFVKVFAYLSFRHRFKWRLQPRSTGG